MIACHSHLNKGAWSDQSNQSKRNQRGVCVFLASGYKWVTVMHEIPISSAQSMTSFLTLGLSSTTPLVPLERGLYYMRRFQWVRSILDSTPWQLLGGQFHNLGSSPCHNIVEFTGEGQTCVHPPSLNYRQLWRTGSKVLARQFLRSKTTAAAHVARVQGKEQGTRYLECTGETQRPYSEHAERETLNFYISSWPSKKTLGVFWELPRIFVAPKNAQNTETKHQSGAVPIPLLALSALTTSAYSSLRVSQELNPLPQLLKALV